MLSPPDATALPVGEYTAAREDLARFAERSVFRHAWRALLHESDASVTGLLEGDVIQVDGIRALRSLDSLRASLGPIGVREFHLDATGQLVGMALSDAAQELWRYSRSLTGAALLALEVMIRRAVEPLEALRTWPPAVVFSPADADLLRRLREEPGGHGILQDQRPRLGAVTAIVKFTRLCNLRCHYCHDWRSGPGQVMPFQTVATALQRLFRDHRLVTIVWHGGEPTLLGVRRIVQILAAEAWLKDPQHRIVNSLQTNGTALTDDLLRILLRYQFSVSVSLDGPPEIHDRVRVGIDGSGSYRKVMEGLGRLRERRLLSGVLIVVTPEVIRLGARRLVEFLMSEQIERVGLLPVRPEAAAGGAVRGPMLPTADYCRFLLEVDRARGEIGGGPLHVREIDAVRRLVAGGRATFCELEGDCIGRYFSIEPDGAVGHCDKFLGDPEYTLGNVFDDTFEEIRAKPAARRLVRANAKAIDRLRSCRWYSYCRGWCPHERYVAAGLGLPAASAGCCGLAPLFDGLKDRIPAPRGRDG